MSARGKTTAGSTAVAKVAQPHGGALNAGGTPGNRGGQPGRSGRKPDEFKARLEAIRDQQGLSVLTDVLGGQITYHLNAVCEHCGEQSTGPQDFGDLLRLVPSVDARMRGVDMTLKYTIGLQKDELKSLIEHPEYHRRVAALRQALVEALGEDNAAQVVMRAERLFVGQ